MSEESQTFESDIARLILSGKIERQEGLAYADSPTNLMWRLQNQSVQSRTPEPSEPHAASPKAPSPTGPSFADFTLDA